MKVKFRKSINLIFLFLFIIVTLSSCGKADISSYEDKQIKIVGLTEEDFYITPKELSEMECSKATAHGKSNEKAGTVKAYGPTMTEFLSHYDRSLDDFYSIRFTAGDEYSVRLGKVTWDQYEIYLSIANGSKPLYEDQEPLRVVIPGSKAGNWIYNVEVIEFTYLEE